MKLADNLDRHKVLDKFKFRPDWTIDYRVTCPLVPKSLIFDLVQRIACLVLIGSLCLYISLSVYVCVNILAKKCLHFH